MAPIPEDIRDLRSVLAPTTIPDVSVIQRRGQRRRRTRQLLAAAGTTAAVVAMGSVALAVSQSTQTAPPASASSTSAAPAAQPTTLPATSSATGDGATGPDYAGSYQEREIKRVLEHEKTWEAEGIAVGRIGVRAGGGTPTIAVEVFGDVQRFVEIALDDRDPKVAVVIEPLAEPPAPMKPFPLPPAPSGT